MSVDHRHFDSTLAFRDFAAQYMPQVVRYSDWGSRAKRGFELLRTGDESNVDEARKMLDYFNESIEVPTYEWRNAVAGAFPNVPEYLAGSPESMWTKYPTESDSTPLRVWVGVTSSLGIPAAKVQQRGITLAAFALALVNKRPVYLTPFINGCDSRGNHHVIMSWDIHTSPLVISELMASLSQPDLTRYLGVPLVHYYDKTRIPYSVPFHHTTKDHLQGFGKDDLYINHIYLHDPLLTDPIKWLKTNIAKYGHPDDE